MKPADEILPSSPVDQIFRAEADHLSGVSVLIATHGPGRTSHLLLEVFRLSGTPRRLSHTLVPLSQVYDNSFVETFFPPESASRGGLYLLRISGPDASPGNAATVYLTQGRTEGEERIGGHVRCAVPSSGWLAALRRRLVRGRRHSVLARPELGLHARLSYSNPISDSPVPPTLEISPVTACNLNCTHCISRGTRKTVKRLPERIREDIARWAREGWLQTAYTDYSGDVLWADARYGGELDFFIGLSVPFHVDTNATHLTRENIDRLLASRITSINVSIDAARDETYRSIRRGSLPLDAIFANMRVLAERRRATGRLDVRLSAAFILMRSNIDELPEFVRRVHAAGFETVRTIHLQVYTADMEGESLWYARDRFNAVRLQALRVAEELGMRLFIDRPFEEVEERVATSLCSLPWRGAYLLGNGDVWACCVPGLRMGNLHEQSMEEIWNGPLYQKLRLTVNSDERPPPCRACPFNRKTNNPLSYMPFKEIQSKDW